MAFKEVSEQLLTLLEINVQQEERTWLLSKLDQIIKERSTRDLYLTYSLVPSKITKASSLSLQISDEDLKAYLELQHAHIHQIARIYLLVRVLEENAEFFTPKVANIIQVADTGELETFLKFLVLLPNPEEYQHQAVEALRTNIATVFNAIAMHNPYPALYFNDQQWNQMYLKAAFMQQDLRGMLSVDKRANKDLARIISDYAHERWAASRAVDPYFWRPVAPFLEEGLLPDMERLMQSDNVLERKVASLCCASSNWEQAKELLQKYPEFVAQINSGELDWDNLEE
ncbi:MULTISPECIES: EboA domain-containing protein [Arenibacter]|uniref:EboA domain-containing protein n=1 Tax=Arenibacter TaxID=178469 RepID=UPI000A3C1178|nr:MULTISPECIES: EboA domain-containing protein [Arenibacter]